MDGALANLARLRDLKSLRVSSWDITGGNTDNWLIRAGHTSTLVNLTGPGCIRHIWMTIAGGEDFLSA